MDDAFIAVVVLVSVLGLVGAVIALATSGGSYEQIGRGGLSLDEPPPPAPPSTAERDAEIRQYLAARNARRVAHGEAPIDVEAELRALTAPAAADPELAAEVRQHVEARNARRVARGEAPLDVDAEVSKRLRDL
jgi:hypothetical protein